MTAPPRVDNVYFYWEDPPPERSAKCAYWLARIKDGWRPNRRISEMGCSESAEFFGIYVWEWVNVVRPIISAAESST
jgi:hypothetical protein